MIAVDRITRARILWSLSQPAIEHQHVLAGIAHGLHVASVTWGVRQWCSANSPKALLCTLTPA